jgi:hypothetical protein
MPIADDTRPATGGVLRTPCLAARCEGCGLAYEVAAEGTGTEPALECDDCGCPVYLVDSDASSVLYGAALTGDLVDVIEGCAGCVAGGVECTFHAGFAAGWDACAAMVAVWVEAERGHELEDAL